MKLTIITITYNAEKFILPTIRSIIAQVNFSDIEYLIIDGVSNDKTIQIVQDNVPFAKIHSEKDNGIYDAMNKGMHLAKGKYIWFMNAGDEISESNCIEKLFSIMKDEPDVIYGETIIIDSKRKKIGLRSQVTPHVLINNINWKDFKYGMLICHQSFIVKKDVAPNFIENNLSADIDWEIKCLKKANSVVKYSGILSNYLLGGVSNQKHLKSLLDRYVVLQNHFGIFQNFLNHILILLRFLLKKVKIISFTFNL
jgi:glycosyltransferase involved in cell wall biosynthesis